MPSQRRTAATRITDTQAAALEAALAISGDTQAQAIRDGLRLYCEQHGVKWPQDMESWGGRRPYGDDD